MGAGLCLLIQYRPNELGHWARNNNCIVACRRRLRLRRCARYNGDSKKEGSEPYEAIHENPLLRN